MSLESGFHIEEIGVDRAAVAADTVARSNLDVARRFGLTLENCPKHPSNCRADWIERALENGGRMWLGFKGKAPVGVAGLSPGPEGAAYMERLGVLPEYRRQGFGAGLVRRALEEAAAVGAKRVEIGIIAANVELAAWYEGLGFIHTGRERFDRLPFEVGFMARDLAFLGRE